MNNKVALMAIQRQMDVDFQQRLEECVELIEAADFECAFYVTQATNEDYPYYLGSGKLEEFSIKIQEQEITTVVCLDELSPSQHRNLEETLNVEVLDRTQLILMIFGRRASSKMAKLQVESARLSYLLPRLKTQRSHTGRQQGGSMKTRGAGETLVDLRRRVATKQFQMIQKELKKLEFVHETQSLARRKSNVIVCAFVGYTNVGKSSLMNACLNALNHSDQKNVVANDRLFETLSTASRSAMILGQEVILTDTVGFVSNLPHSLIKAFHSTLAEVKNADILIHVIDGSSDKAYEERRVTLETLKEIEVDDKPIITVYNKADLKSHPGLNVSAKEAFNIDLLIDAIHQQISKLTQFTQLLIPYDKIGELNRFKKEYSQAQIRESEEGFIVSIPYPLNENSEWKIYTFKGESK